MNTNRIKPYDANAEAAVLSAMMLGNDAIIRAVERLEVKHIYSLGFKKIFKAIIEVYDSGAEVDLVTVIDRLKTNNDLESVGGEIFINELSDVVMSDANMEFHIAIIIEKYGYREIIDQGYKLVEDAFAQNVKPKELLDKYGINADIGKTQEEGFIPIIDSLPDTIKLIEQLQAGDMSIMWVKTHLDFFDKDNIGFKKGSLNIVAARPGMGKTSLMMNMVKAQADHLLKIGISSMEMSTDDLTIRMIASESGIPGNIIMSGKVYESKIDHLLTTANELSEYKIFINQTPRMTMNSLKASFEKLMKQSGEMDIWYIDYLQLMEDNGRENRNLEIANITRGLKILAKEYNIPIVVLSQLNRALENRQDKFPRLSDLRESGNIEQDADTVYFLVRPDVYVDLKDKDIETPIGSYRVTPELSFLYSAKIRHSSIGMIPLKFNGALVEFEECAQIL